LNIRFSVTLNIRNKFRTSVITVSFLHNERWMQPDVVFGWDSRYLSVFHETWSGISFSGWNNKLEAN